MNNSIIRKALKMASKYDERRAIERQYHKRLKHLDLEPKYPTSKRGDKPGEKIQYSMRNSQEVLRLKFSKVSGLKFSRK